MEDLCEREKIAIPEESLAVVAREAGGSMRDALSLLDQVMSCSDGPVTHDQVLNILGVVDRRALTDMVDAVLVGDIARVLARIQQVYERGQDLKKLFTDLLIHMRNLLVIKLGDPAMSIVDLPESEIDLMREQVRRHSAGVLNQVFKMLYREEALVRLAAQPRLAIEMVLMQICQIKPALPMDELIGHVEALRQAISEGGRGGKGEQALTATPHISPPITGTPSSANDGTDGTGVQENQRSALPSTSKERHAFWSRILDDLGKHLPALAANLQQSSLVVADANCFEIEVRGNEFGINRVKRSENIQAIRRAAHDLLGLSPKIVIHGISDDPAAKREQKKNEDRVKQNALSHPMVSDVVEIFQGKVLDVKVLPKSEGEGSK
jgi:DNA polymerase-3 subunit gamma/tau